jgi:hypothetical protein
MHRGRLGRVGMRDLGGESEVGQDGADHAGILDGGHQTEATVTPGGGQIGKGGLGGEEPPPGVTGR